MPGKPWTLEQQNLLAAHYATMRSSDLSKLIGRSRTACNQKAASMGLVKAAEGMPNRFGPQRNPGDINRGKISRNAVPIGAERTFADGDIYVKIRHCKERYWEQWKRKRIVMWEEYNKQKVKKGEIVIFANGDKLDFSKENLVKIPKKQWFESRTVHTLPKEIMLMYHAKSTLVKAINRSRKK